jgi:hypothetical protein
MDDAHYQEAWTRSGGRNARSKRSLGKSALRRKVGLGMGVRGKDCHDEVYKKLFSHYFSKSWTMENE